MNKKILWATPGVLLVILIIIGYFFFLRTYTVIFDSQSTNNYATQTIRVGERVTKPGDPARVGYLFLGWYNGDEKYDFTQPVKENLTLVAKWQEIVDKNE